MKYHSSFLAIPLFLFSASAMSAVTPKITKISVTPTSAPAGTMFKFSAEINNPLPEGYKVKIAPIGLTGFTTMISDVKNSYALSRAIYTTGKQKYKVVIVNAKNAIQGASKIGTYTVLSAAASNKAPMLSLVKAENTATTNTAYTVTFNAKDVDGNLSSITMNWGDNSEPETLTATDSKDLTFSHIYTSASSFGWNAFASDKGTPVLNSQFISKIVTVSNPALVEVIAPQVSTCLTPNEKTLANIVMQYRESKGLPAIPLSQSLSIVAQTHAKDLQENLRQENCNMHSWSDKGGWTSCCYTDDHAKASCMWDKPRELTNYNDNGFEIAANVWSSSPSLNQISAEEALEMWKNSPGHNNVIINQSIWDDHPWKAMGIGISQNYAVIWFGETKEENETLPCK